RNHLTELRAAALRFTESEATQFLNDIMGLSLDAESITLLEERSEGWIAGLQMAALSMRDRKDIGAFIENFSGTNRYILDYLLEEVLANQPPEIQQFLLHTAILKRLSGSLCDALLEGENQSASILEYLEQVNLFLIPLDDDRNWYRYHHLFSDLLSARLQQTHSDKELSDLHTRAAQWYEKNRMAYGAIYHSSLIPNDEWVERIIDQNYMEIFQRRDSASIRLWTGELGKELIFKRPQLAIHEANSRAWFGKLDEADHLLDEAEKHLKAEASTPEIQAMCGYLAYVRSRVTAMRGDFEQAIQLCNSARENTPANNEGLLGGIGVMLGYGYFLNGEFAQAVQTLRETIRSGKNSGAINTTVAAYCVLARLSAIQGQLQKSYDLYREAEIFIQQSEGEHRGAMSIVDMGYAEILYEWNNLEAASTHIQQGLEFIPLWSKADDIALAHITYSQIQQAQGNTLAAEKNIEKGSQVIRSSGMFSEARDAVTAAEIDMWLIQENCLAINRWVRSIENRLTSDQPYRFENELILMSLARAYLAQENFDEVMALLTQLESSAQTGGREGRLIKIFILQALVMYRKGEKDPAFSIVERALGLAEPGCYVRSFINEGQPMLQLLSRWLSRTEKHPLKAYANQLVAQFNDKSLSALDGQGKTDFEDELIEPLSPREIEVLSLIALGKTNKEISAELVVSPG
ncbi:LuxR C-terminal-related transcriptional regulator, partial [Chloroflexota bacterium]